MKRLLVHTKIVPYKNHQEHYITLTNLDGNTKALKSLFSNLEKRKARIVKVTYLGNRDIGANVNSVTKKYPTLLIGNSPRGASLKNASVCIHAVEGQLKKFEYIKIKGVVTGAHFVCENYEILSVAGIGSLQNSFDKEVRAIYGRVDAILSKYKFSPKSVYRFWNYIEDISKNYKHFNASRDRYYQKYGITKYPAATGIEASLTGSSNIRIGFEAIKSIHKKDVVVKIVRSNMQNEAWEYGPKFSRAMLVQFQKGGSKKLYVSGTSSIDKKGTSIYTNNAAKNIQYVIASVEHLLKKNDMTLESLVTSYVYCRNAKVQKEFERLYAAGKWTFPYNLVITNICRKDLMFEVEGIAAANITSS